MEFLPYLYFSHFHLSLPYLFIFRESYREILTADATVVDLHKLGPYFFSFGTHLLKYELPESPDVAKILVKVG